MAVAIVCKSIDSLTSVVTPLASAALTAAVLGVVETAGVAVTSGALETFGADVLVVTVALDAMKAAMLGAIWPTGGIDCNGVDDK